MTAYVTLMFAEIVTPSGIMQYTPLRLLPWSWQLAVLLATFLLLMTTGGRAFWVLWHEQKRERAEQARRGQADRLGR
jgi:hypothetical protein